MIKKLTDELFLYNGDVLSRGDLENKILNLESQKLEINNDIDSIEFIKPIPEIEANPQYKEAMELYNSEKDKERGLLMIEVENINQVINDIKRVL